MASLKRAGVAAIALALGGTAAQAEIRIAHVYGQTGPVEAYAE